MPETRVERAVFVLGLVAIGALALLVVYYWRSNRVAAAPAPAPTTVALSAQQPRGGTAPAPRSATSAPVTKTRPGTASTVTTGASITTTTAAIVPGGATSLVLTASRDTWLEVRSGSSTGTLLYSGILASGASKTFRAAAIWTRFGSGGNLQARVDGRRLVLPRGTYNALFDSNGFQQVRG